ncbi:uncharacterized protein A1O9_01335 [Exophiala aquamarina CBS 119918]|uniref:A-kinase anchor protein 7-like phosphoesterase domain-containing protein n=1 Tax=Exophiala aquamarina CBS 119918 TaxID=1182545 RepID=A0A072PVK4_9EURO|nr:uncharacterized protein A1O9_01335 [Exophiala aquamarina CBS 119918]KEF63358.1 hypothetical protein A1O9_01335 [Exophiala aquamarina CBS 119918]
MAPKKGKFAKPIRAHIKWTHFVCLPLATEASVPQLKESLANFRHLTTKTEDAAWGSAGRTASEHVRSSSLPKQQISHDEDRNSTSELVDQSSTPGSQDLRKIPTGAHRPPGTLHLTLGVMDLSAKEDMERALRLLEDLDYVDLLRQAETMVKGRQLERENRRKERLSEDKAHDETPTSAAPLESLHRSISPPSLSSPFSKSNDVTSPTQDLPTPISVTLHGLGTFPSPRSSRAFFAHAHDPSKRLQTFAELVRQRFMNVALITDTRPLVLHATVANLIYVKGKKAQGGKAREIDAREILRFFNHLEKDDESGFNQQQPLEPSEGGVAELSHSQSKGAPDSATTHLSLSSTLLDPQSSANTGDDNEPQGHIWARDIKIDRVRICKMGADPCDIPDWGMEYKYIGERIFLP